MSESERTFLFFLGLVFLVASSLLIGHILWRLLWKKGKGEVTNCQLSSFQEEVSTDSDDTVLVTIYEVEIDYRYYGNGLNYHGKEKRRSRDLMKAFTLVEIYQEGAKVPVYSNPTISSLSSLKRLAPNVLIYLCLCLAGAITCLYIVFQA